MRGSRITTALVAAALLAGACGGDDSGEDTETSETTTTVAGTAEPAEEASDTTVAGAVASDFDLTIEVTEPADFAGTYTIADLDPGLSSYICFGGEGSGLTVQLAGLVGLPLTQIDFSTDDAVDGPGTYPASGRVIEPDYNESGYGVAEVQVEAIDADGSSGSFTLGPDDFAPEQPVVAGTWDCGPA